MIESVIVEMCASAAWPARARPAFGAGRSRRCCVLEAAALALSSGPDAWFAHAVRGLNGGGGCVLDTARLAPSGATPDSGLNVDAAGRPCERNRRPVRSARMFSLWYAQPVVSQKRNHSAR